MPFRESGDNALDCLGCLMAEPPRHGNHERGEVSVFHMENSLEKARIFLRSACLKSEVRLIFS